MAENNAGGGPPKGIEDLLKERERLERELKEKYRKRLSILFTDICGYTQYIDERGDISGRTLLLKHNSIVFPQIEGNGGKVVEVIGDAVMAAFGSTADAVRAAIAIQKALEAHNQQAESGDRIHVKIGINTGEALVDEGAPFQSITGDVANVASRIQSQAGRDEILISRSVYDEVRRSEDILCRFHGSLPVKGKAGPLEIYKAIWRHDAEAMGREDSLRVYESVPEKAPKQKMRAVHLEITREGDRLKIGAYERADGEESTLRHYEELSVSMEAVDRRCLELVETLNKANRRGLVSREVLVKVREIGQVLHDELFTVQVKEALKNTRAEYLILNIDDHLVHIPWELLCDGRDFLCQRFNMGRLVKTRQNLQARHIRKTGIPLKMLILADPKSDLKGAYAEGTRIRDFMDQRKEAVNVTLRADKITRDSVMEKMGNFDLVHFAGHADYHAASPEESGLRLSDGALTTRDIVKMAESAAMPALIFSNACQSARTEAWALGDQYHVEIFGLANAFLLAGVKHYVGTFWEILDRPSSQFALEFYRELLAGRSVGEAVRNARSALIRQYGEETIVWASYVLYGDPMSSYVPEAAGVGVEEGKVPKGEPVAKAEETEKDAAAVPRVKRAAVKWWAMAAGIVLLAGGLYWGLPRLWVVDTSPYEKEALAHFQAGRYGEAVKACEAAREKAPDRPLASVILGNIRLLEGKLEDARKHYESARAANSATEEEKSQALMGLGRIASARKEDARAAEYYERASRANPRSGLAYASQAILMDRQGDPGKASELFAKAQTLTPADRALAAAAREARERAAIAQDREKQERIDTLVKELLGDMKRPVPPVASDGWTSQTLTLWVMEPQSTGYGLTEGEERLFVSGLMDLLMEKTRVQIVERAVLDKVLQELRLGTSKLVDRNTALSLGRILAARLIISGQIVRAGAETQVALRLIETETGRISASVNEIFTAPISPSALAERISNLLAEKIREQYPLRGKVTEVRDNEVALNIGAREGVRAGDTFRVCDTEFVVEVKAAEKEKSTAVFKQGAGMLKPQARVEARYSATAPR
jgi:class 3 adenylate cyclase/tetratricopeptide (TPR) repeat protein